MRVIATLSQPKSNWWFEWHNRHGTKRVRIDKIIWLDETTINGQPFLNLELDDGRKVGLYIEGNFDVVKQLKDALEGVPS